MLTTVMPLSVDSSSFKGRVLHSFKGRVLYYVLHVLLRPFLLLFACNAPAAGL
jgi:hypothetical protein